MSWLQAILLGLLQGVTEFLPVSSTAHMDIVPQLFGQQDPGAAFSAIAQLGPIVAIIAYFRSDLIRYVRGILRTGTPANIKSDDQEARLGWYVLLGTLPLALFGVLLEHKIDTSFRRLSVVAVSLIALGLILWVAERVGRRNTPLEKITFGQSQVIGWAQVLALVPGTSRSGVTITAGLFQGLDRESAARFSFLLSIPAITAAGLYKLFKAVKAHEIAGHIAGKGLAAALVAGVFAYIVVTWFLKYMKEHNTFGFILYRIVLGVAVLVLLHTGRLHERKAEEEKPQTPPVSLLLPGKDEREGDRRDGERRDEDRRETPGGNASRSLRIAQSVDVQRTAR
jgi:undecaprenyl-diphosphatase